MILLTVVRDGGSVVNSVQELFNPERMFNIKVQPSGNIGFDYPRENGFPRYVEVSGITSLTALQGLINSNAPQGKTTLIGVIDFALGMAATGTYDIKDVNGNVLVLPANTRVHNGYLETVTTFTGATATIAVGFPVDGTTTAILGTTTATTLTAGTKTALTPVGTAASATAKTTAARNVQLTIATAALTAGKAYLFIDIVTTGV